MENNINFKEENGILTVLDEFNSPLSFQICSEVPLGYEIWNISGMPDGYLPLCRLAMIQPFDGARNVETDTLKAIKCEGASEMIRAASCGFGTLKKAEAFVKKYAEKRSKRYELVRVWDALPYMRELKWD